jgi:hypothetical protein
VHSKQCVHSDRRSESKIDTRINMQRAHATQYILTAGWMEVQKDVAPIAKRHHDQELLEKLENDFLKVLK